MLPHGEARELAGDAPHGRGARGHFRAAGAPSQLARLERRPLRLRNASPALVELLDLTGLGTPILTPTGVWDARPTR